MRQKTGFPRPYLVTSTPDAGRARREKIVRSAIRRIEACRADLLGAGHDEPARILDIALLQLAVTLNDLDENELKALTDAFPCDRPKPSVDFEDRA